MRKNQLVDTADALLNRMLKSALMLIESKDLEKKKILEETYIRKYLLQDSEFISNPLLKLLPEAYSRFLMELRRKNRHLFLLKSRGHSIRELAKFLGYSSHTVIQKFLMGNEKLSKKLLSQLAILYRVPPSWLTDEKCVMEWVTHHFEWLGIEAISIAEFVKSLHNANSKTSWIKFYIIKTTVPDEFFYLRVECQHESIIVECFNAMGTITDFQILVRSIENNFLVVIPGLIDTAIPFRKNPALMCRVSSGLFCRPIEFKEYS